TSCDSGSSANQNSRISDLEYKGAVLTHIHNFEDGYGSEKSKSMQVHLKKSGYDSVQLNTFGYMENIKSTKIFYKHDLTLSNKAVRKEIQNLKSNGFKVVLKPHIWIGGLNFDPENWINKIDYQNQKDLEKWFKNYTDFILDQARVAEEEKVELFVIGTELVGLVKYKSHWEKLIQGIRTVYKGKLTYAAEGRKAKNVPFWESLDYIGIDAYFPLSNKINPTLDELTSGWNKYNQELEKLSSDNKRKIIFTELGYKSVEGTSIKPWLWIDSTAAKSEKEQADCYRATFEFIKKSPYIAGIFIWKYFTDMESKEEADNIEKGFTPYKKEAEKVVSEYLLSAPNN
ncbi:MAG: glycoside hydrolase family 113, partial [Thermodesulfobacteriota bacterium]